MKPSPLRTPLLVTHGLAVFAGSLIGMLLFRDPASTGPGERADSIPPRSSAPDHSSLWPDQSLRKLREEQKAEAIREAPFTTTEEFLKTCRERAATEQKEHAERVDEIVKKSANHANEPDPKAAIRRNLRAGNREVDHSREILQAWLDKDPQAALEEVGGNWRLSQEETIPLMLERKFGREWLKKQVEDDLTPVRLRASLTDCLGRDLGWSGNLEALLVQYRSLEDLDLKLRLVNSFAWSWPLDDPLVTARFLENDIPVEMREELMDRWTPPPVDSLPGNGSFPVGVVMPPSYANREWFNKVQAALNPGSPEIFTPPFPEGKAVPAKSLTEEVNAHVKSGDSRENAAAAALSRKIDDAMIEGTDLEELYGEGRISRAELLEELARRIPGAENFPDALEREAWRVTSMKSDARQAAAWAQELSERSAGRPLVPDGSDNDPRISLRLSRYQIFCDGISDDSVVSKIRNKQSYEWHLWHTVAPALASAWRDALPPESPLRVKIREPEGRMRK